MNVKREQEMASKMMAALREQPGLKDYRPDGCQHKRGHKTIRASLSCIEKIADAGAESVPA